jgi:dTDP-D-glucose 4,6-dehydratase
MKFETCEIKGLIICKPKIINDKRGFFTETFRKDLFDNIKQNKNSSIDLISYVDDRLGHDYRYAIDISKIKNELGWEPKTNINKGLRNTLNWYLND